MEKKEKEEKEGRGEGGEGRKGGKRRGEGEGKEEAGCRLSLEGAGAYRRRASF